MLRKIVLTEASIGAANESVEVVCGVTPLPVRWVFLRSTLGRPVWSLVGAVTRNSSGCARVDLAQSRLVQHRSLTVTEITHDFFVTCPCGVQLAALSEFWCVPAAYAFSNPGCCFPPVRRVVQHTGAVPGGWVTALPVLHFLPHVTVDPNG